MYKFGFNANIRRKQFTTDEKKRLPSF